MKLNREELPKQVVSFIMNNFTAPVIDMKKEYKHHSNTRSYNFVMDKRDSTSTYRIVIEPRYADIIAVVEVYEISH